jgi:hypothetical protein
VKGIVLTRFAGVESVVYACRSPNATPAYVEHGISASRTSAGLIEAGSGWIKYQLLSGKAAAKQVSAELTRCCLMRVDPNHTIPVIHNHDGVA